MPSHTGLDISDESIKYAELAKTRRGIKLRRHGEKDIPLGVIMSGKIIAPEKLTEILSELRKGKNIKHVRVSLPEEQVYLFKLRLPKAGLENIREGIELVLEEHVPIPATEAVFDYEILSQDKQELDIGVAVIEKSVIENYLLVFREAQVKVGAFELEGNAIKRAVIKSGDTNAYMIVDFGKERTGIFIISRGAVAFTSTLDIGGATLTGMIEKNFNISREEAERMKVEYGLRRNTGDREIFSVLLNGVSVLRDEISKHYIYWHTHKDETGAERPKVEKLILTGGDSNLTGLAEYLSVSLKIKAELANVWVNIVDPEKYIPEINAKKSLSFTTAIGLALGDYLK